MSKTKLYKIWTAMIQRCENPRATGYEIYGARGIKVCERWHSFPNFHEDMGDRPPKKSLDRHPNRDGNYEPGNVRWATDAEQIENRRPYVHGKPSKTGIPGVYWKKSHNKFVARIAENGRRRYIGFFDSIETAKQAMDMVRPGALSGPFSIPLDGIAA